MRYTGDGVAVFDIRVMGWLCLIYGTWGGCV